MSQLYDEYDVIKRVRRGDLPAILASDTTAGADIWGFLQKLPDNLWYAFYDPREVNVDDLGRLSEKALKRYYKPTLRIVNAVSLLTNPRLRKGGGIQSLINLDLDSYTYMEPVLHEADQITLKSLEPMFFIKGGTSTYDKLTSTAASIVQLSETIKAEGVTDETQKSFNDTLKRIKKDQENAYKEVKKLAEDVKKSLSEIDQIAVSTKSTNLKRERVLALREHLLRVQKQGVDLLGHMTTASKEMQNIASSGKCTPEDFVKKLSAIGANLKTSATQTKNMADELADLAYARRARKVRIRENGRIIGEENAAAENYRQLKLGMDVRFVPGNARKLPVVKSKVLSHNAENYFIMSVEYGLKNAFKPDGTYIPLGERGPRYGEDMGEYIAKMYSLGRPEDALYAIQLLKMAEGRQSYQLFPGSFQEVVRRHMARFYGLDDKEIENDPHARLFLERVRDISGNRNHSPLVWGPRDTDARYYKNVKDFIYGRMYPGSDQFIAIPLHQKLIQNPIVRMRSKAIAYVTGGRVVNLDEMGRPAKDGSILEEELSLAIKRNWFWWEKKKEKTDSKESAPGFFARAPVWFNVPLRAGMLASVPAAIILGTGGVAAPALIVYPVVAAGAAAGAKYALTAAKGVWALPFVNKPIKFAAKWTAISAATAGSVFLIAPFAPAIGVWGMGMAAAHPLIAAGIASPFASLVGLKCFTLVKAKKKDDVKTTSFATYRENTLISNDPQGLWGKKGLLTELAPAPKGADEKDVDIVIKLKEPERDVTQTTNQLVEEFLRRMEGQNKEFLTGLHFVFTKNSKEHKSAESIEGEALPIGKDGVNTGSDTSGSEGAEPTINGP